MRRVAMFVLLGPFLVWLILVVPFLPRFIRIPDPSVLPFASIVLLIIFVIGFFPALAVAGADHLMAMRGFSRMNCVVACAVLGYPAAVLAFYVWIAMAGLGSSFTVSFFEAGLFGIFPAAICAWLSEAKLKPAAPGNA